MLSISAFAILSLLVALSIRFLHTYNRLRHIPGPRLAVISDIWRFYMMNQPAYGERMVQLHRKYGKLVRLGPNRVSTSDPAAVPIVFSTSPVWEKAPSYRVSAPYFRGKSMPSIVSMTEAQSTAVHRVAGGSFTANALLDYEDFVDQSCAELLIALKERPKPIDVSRWFALFAMDVINRIAFSDSMGFLKCGEDVENMIAATKDRFDHWGRWAAVPELERWLFRSPLARLWQKPLPSSLAAAGQRKLAQRMDPEQSSASKSRLDLLDKFLLGTEKHPGLVTEKEITGMVQSTIGAGADTTAATLAILFVYLSRDPKVVDKLRQELSEASEAGNLSKAPKWMETYRMPYLDAVIKEAMRLFPVSQWGHDRVVPPGGATIAGFFVPEGTVVGCHLDSIHRNADVYGKDADEYNPERWLTASEPQKALMERCMLGFGAGKRICLGRHIAWLELKKLIPLLVMHLDIQLLDPHIDLVEVVQPSSVRYIPPLMASVRVL